MGERQFVSLDVLGTDDELRDRARAENAAGPDAGRNARGEAEGRDDRRTVTVRIDPAGRVSDVLLSHWWRDELSPAGLTEAMLAAYRSALTHAATAVGPRLADPPESSAPSPVDAGEPVAGDDDLAWLEDIRRRLGRVDENLERADHLLHEQPADRVLTGPAGFVRLRVHGRTVSRVEIDAGVALRESPNRLAADALAAFQAMH